MWYPTHSVFQGGIYQDTWCFKVASTHSVFQGGISTHSVFQGGISTHSVFQGGISKHSVFQGGISTHSVFQGGISTHSVLQVVSQAALQDAKQLILNAFDENKDGRIDIAEVWRFSPSVCHTVNPVCLFLCSNCLSVILFHFYYNVACT